MMNRQTSIAYIDFLTVLLAVFVVVTGVLLSQNHELSQGNITSKAEFVVTLEWPEGSESDVDLWLRNPFGDVVNFKHKDRGLITLDHDDVGFRNNMVTGPDGKPIRAVIRRETASIRGIMPGRHVVNVMLYALRGDAPVVATVLIVKLNPYSIIAERQISLRRDGEEHTVASFDVAPDGSLSNVDTTDEISLAKVIK